MLLIDHSNFKGFLLFFSLYGLTIRDRIKIGGYMTEYA